MGGLHPPLERPLQGLPAPRVRHLPRDHHHHQKLHEGRFRLREEVGPDPQGVALLRKRQLSRSTERSRRVSSHLSQYFNLVLSTFLYTTQYYIRQYFASHNNSPSIIFHILL